MSSSELIVALFESRPCVKKFGPTRTLPSLSSSERLTRPYLPFVGKLPPRAERSFSLDGIGRPKALISLGLTPAIAVATGRAVNYVSLTIAFIRLKI